MEVEQQPSPLGAGAGVCCMCGDRGLPHELLRCKLCRVRLQHRYCSDLYPRATAYRRCNWCLIREPTDVQALARAVAASKTGDKRKAVASPADASTSKEEEEERVCRRSHEAAGCATTRSRRPAAEVGRPVKKHKAGDRAALPPMSPGATAKGNNGGKKQKADERATPPAVSPGATAKGSNGSKIKHKADERAALPPSPGATAKADRINSKHKADERVVALPPSPGPTAKAPMQAGKLTRPGRVKVRRYKLLAEVISC